MTPTILFLYVVAAGAGLAVTLFLIAATHRLISLLDGLADKKH